MSVQQPFLKIDVAHVPHACVVRIQGELDIAGCPAVEHALEEAEQSRAERLIIDIEELTFIDSTGLGVLFNASRRSATNGNRLEITRGKGSVARVFRLTELDKTLPLTDAFLCPAIRDVDARGGPLPLPAQAACGSTRGAGNQSSEPAPAADALSVRTTRTEGREGLNANRFPRPWHPGIPPDELPFLIGGDASCYLWAETRPLCPNPR